ncbi:MAG: histidine phosphatase family protein [Chloroflexi bacterium]|nr:histidine phosphatase family protein [Chloroflexota bacterium]
MTPGNPPTYHITLLRHGESVGNAEGYHQGQAEFPLTDKGRRQARALADHWSARGVSFDQAIASPLSRARETAEIITAALNIPLSFDSIWMERNNGLLAGLPHSTAAERYPIPDFVSLYHPIARTGESLWELFIRSGRAVETIMRQPPGRYLIVSHGALLDMAFHAILGAIPHPNFHGFALPLRNTAYSRLRYTPQEGQWRLLTHNEHPHFDSIAENASGLELPPDAYHFTLLRHGESVGNAEDKLQGQADYPLTERGREQARLLAARWRAEKVTFDKAIASPLERAHKTAQIISESLGLPLEIAPAWMEFDWGDLNGLSSQEVDQRSATIQWDDPYFPIGGDGESRWSVYLRASRSVQDLINSPPGRYLIVAHGAILNRFLSAVLGLTPQNRASVRFAFENTAFADLYFIPDRHLWVLDSLNNHDHLEQEDQRQ